MILFDIWEILFAFNGVSLSFVTFVTKYTVVFYYIKFISSSKTKKYFEIKVIVIIVKHTANLL